MRIAAVLFLGSLVACGGACSGIPAAVVRVDDLKTPQKGIRYFLKTPVFKPGLRFRERTKDRKVHYDVILRQTMDGKPLVFEVRPSPRPLSDTTLIVDLDEKGALSAVTAGEDNKTAEIAAAVAAIAVGAAAFAVNADDPDPLKQYLARQEEIESRRQAVIQLVKERRKVLATQRNANLPGIADELNVLEAELERLEEDRREVFPLSDTACRILVDGKPVYGRGNSPLVTIRLSRSRSSRP